MEQYKLPSHINPDKVFIVNRSELQGRFDTSFYKERLDFTNCTKLSKLVKIKGGKRIPLGYDYSDTETSNLYLRVADIPDEKDLDFNGLKYISDELYYILRRYETFENDLIISIAGSIGKIQIIKNIPKGRRVILTENCAKIVLTDNRINPEYFALVLRTKFLQKQIELGYIQTTIPKLGLDKIQELQIPAIPSLEIQQQIVDLYQEAYNQKQQKEAEAKALLDSIDSYLLGELGITLPEKDNSLQKRVFTTEFSKVTGNRVDSYYYKAEFINLYTAIDKGRYQVLTVKDCIRSITNGFDFRDYATSGNPYIKVANVRPYEFDFNNIQYINLSSSELTKSIQLKKSNLLLTRKGSFGIALALDKNYDYIISSEVFYLDLKNDIISSGYMEAFFNSSIDQMIFDRIKIGAIMGSLSQEAVLNMKIPLPPLEKQNEIAQHIQSVREQAKQLQNDAKTILEQAKKEVEEIILDN